MNWPQDRAGWERWAGLAVGIGLALAILAQVVHDRWEALSLVLVVLALGLVVAGFAFFGFSLREMNREARRPDLAKVSEDIKQMSRRERRAGWRTARSGKHIADPDEARRAEAIARHLKVGLGERSRAPALLLLLLMWGLWAWRWLQAGSPAIGGAIWGPIVITTLFVSAMLYTSRVRKQLDRTAEANAWELSPPPSETD